MSNLGAVLILALAALLEAGGDAIVRTGLHAKSAAGLAALVLLGGAVLTTYGVVVNTPRWDFGRLLGVYVTLFFCAAQILDVIVFKSRLSPPVFVAGALILSGGAVMTFWRTP